MEIIFTIIFVSIFVPVYVAIYVAMNKDSEDEEYDGYGSLPQ